MVRGWLAGPLLAGLVGVAAGQESASLGRARAAYEDLDYSSAIVAARTALQERLRPEEQVTAYELLGFSYGALDSTRQAVEAFQQLIFLAPDREPDVERVSPRITSLYASALGQVLVVRRVEVDSVSFIAGSGALPIGFEVSRAAQTFVRLLGPDVDVVIDSQLVSAGPSRVFWSVVDSARRPFPPGDYEVIVTAREGSRNEYASAPFRFRLGHERVDTLELLGELPGYTRQPEMVSPPRDWRPVLLAALYVGAMAGTFLALDDADLGTGPRTAMFGVGGVGLTTGLVLSLKKPEPRPSPTNIQYNHLLGELLAQRNAEIARENDARRAQTVLRIQRR
jgi:hypothetical protein